LPPVLLAVPFTESGFNVAARSSVGSAGLWQFIPATARRQGLVVDAARDDRLDPEKSTAAALAHLSDLHRTLGDWTLAIAAYNCGIENVQAAIHETASSDVATMARAGKLCGDAQRGYAQTVLASMLLLFDPQQQHWLNAEARPGGAGY
jgi:membrane-bound lytic murein transglycosylase D